MQADRAVDELRRAGFRDEQIGVAMRHDSGMRPPWATPTDAADAKIPTPGRARSRASLAGLGLGALAGLGVLSGVIPVIGPAIAGGTLGIILSNAAVGAGVGGLVGALVGAGVPEDEAHYYQGEFESGRTIVTVQAGGRADEAMAVFRRYGAYDMSSRPDSRRHRRRRGEQAHGHPRPGRGRDRRRARHGHGRGGRGRSRHRPHRALSGRDRSAHGDRIARVAAARRGVGESRWAGASTADRRPRPRLV